MKGTILVADFQFKSKIWNFSKNLTELVVTNKHPITTGIPVATGCLVTEMALLTRQTERST
jgi:hypothetical protein